MLDNTMIKDTIFEASKFTGPHDTIILLGSGLVTLQLMTKIHGGKTRDTGNLKPQA